MQDNYCLRSDYISGTQNNTVSSETDSEYWSDHMIYMAGFYQYPVYLYVRDLILKNGLNSILDVGCGPATKLAILIAPICRDIVAIDQHSAIEYCRQHYDFAEFIEYEIEQDTFPLKRTFELIICADVIEHLVDPDKLLEDIHVASNNDTLIVISTPDRDTLRGKGCLHSPNAVHVREWNMEEFSRYISSRGFVILEHRLLPPMRFNLTREYFRETVRQLLSLRNPFSCQIVICKKRI